MNNNLFFIFFILNLFQLFSLIYNIKKTLMNRTTYDNNTTPIRIKNSLPENKQYSLKQNLFDPMKSSPPNTFMLKLYSRMIEYESGHKKNFILDNK
jgi:hypothetical protein